MEACCWNEYAKTQPKPTTKRTVSYCPLSLNSEETNAANTLTSVWHRKGERWEINGQLPIKGIIGVQRGSQCDMLVMCVGF